MTRKLPHENTFVRLGISKIHGIGVFAIRLIPQATNLFADDHLKIKWVDAAAVRSVANPELAKLYEDFCIRREGQYGCPRNFNMMTIGWYLNEPPRNCEENVLVDKCFSFYARRDIQVGEELTVRYSDFSDLQLGMEGWRGG